MSFLRPISDRYFEDYIEGDVHRFGTIAVEADEIVAFANRFDPQTLHTERGSYGLPLHRQIV
jgi:acyl dehydratase